jgi:hypothetical protein
MGEESSGYLKNRLGKTNKTCASSRQLKGPLRWRRGVSLSEDASVTGYIASEEQDLSGVLKADGPLGQAGIGAAGRTRRTGGDG